MATLRDIKRRIDSVRNTRQITSAMKMVSTAKLNRAQNQVRAAQPYSEELRSMVTSISSGLTADDHQLFQSPEGGSSVVMLFTSDRGLCGAFNTALCKNLERHVAANRETFPDLEIITIGRTGNDYFKKRGFKIRRSVLYAKPDERKLHIKDLIEELNGAFISGEVGRLFLAYNHFNNPISQEPRVTQLLPIAPPKATGVAGEEKAKDQPATARELIFEPSREHILDLLLPRYMENQCFLAHLNTEAGEHGARMVAMDGATRNAGDMIERLTLQYNRVRQAAITKELIEIVNGAQAI